MQHETLKKILTQAKKKKQAIGHFNAATFEQMKAIVQAADKLKTPVMIGTSEGELNYLGAEKAVAMVDSFQKQTKTPLFLNLDHAKSFEICKKAIDAGYDSIHFDGSKLEYKENVKLTKKVRDYAKLVNPLISVEGELGMLPTDSSTVYKKKVKVDKKQFTDPKQAKQFVERTRIDRLAPSFGTLHGIQAGGENPHIDHEHLKKIQVAVPNIFIVMHGGSGTPKSDITKAVHAGLVVNIHISTEIRQIYVTTLRKQIKKDEYAPYKILPPVIEAMQKLIEKKIKSFK